MQSTKDSPVLGRSSVLVARKSLGGCVIFLRFVVVIIIIKMGCTCCVKNCRKTSKLAIMHKFPADQELCRIWCERIGRMDLFARGQAIVRRNYRVCDIHFDEKSKFDRYAKKSNLKVGSIPSIFLHVAEAGQNMEIQPNGEEVANVSLSHQQPIERGPLPKEVSGTANLLPFMDRLFDSVNALKIDPEPGKRYRSAVQSDTPHVAFWLKAKQVLQYITYVKGKRGYVPPSIKNWIIILDGLIDLWRRLSTSGFTSLSTRNLNQDALENFFGSIRNQGGRNINLTVTSFRSKFHIVKYLEQRQFRSRLLALLHHHVNYFLPSNCSKHDLHGMFLKLFVHFFIYLTNVNSILSGKVLNNINDSVKPQALQRFKKYGTRQVVLKKQKRLV